MTRWLWVFVLCWPCLIGPWSAQAQPSGTGWAVVPPVAYPETVQIPHARPVTSYSVTILAPQSASFNAQTYWLRFQGATPLLACATPVALGSPAPTANEPTPCTVRFETQNGGQQARFSLLPTSLQGAQTFTVEANGSTTSFGPLQVSFALVSSAAVRIYAALAFAVLVGIVLLLLNSGRGRTLTTGTSMGLLKSAFIDMETRTYSLSMVQFYVWGFAVISSYIYLTMARSLVQGALEFAAVPDNLPLLMGISVGTTAASLGVTSMAGGKGAGDVDPTPADLITSGGVVAPERLLHLMWTIIGGVAFIGFAFSIPPETIDNLPAVPSGFLELMGVSAAGYVGGKIARGPGPNIRSITVDPPNGGAAHAAVTPLPVKIEGTNLATEGATYLMSQVDPPAIVGDTPVQVVPVAGSVIDAQKAATCIKAQIAAVPPGLAFAVGNKYRFTIVNPDGEKASWDFVVS